MIRMLTYLKSAIETFNNFVIILGAGPSLKLSQRSSYKLPDHWNFTNFCEILSKGTEKYASLRSIFHSKSSCSIWNFRQCRPYILKCLQGINLQSYFKFITGRFSPSFFWIAPFSSISKTSCSSNESCYFDIFVRVGIFLVKRKTCKWVFVPFCNR